MAQSVSIQHKVSTPVWQHPWSYAEGFCILSGLLLCGFTLQWFNGAFPKSFVQWPLNAVFIVVFSVLLTLTFYLKRQSPIVRWLSGIQASVASLVGFGGLTIIMGLIPQHSSTISHQHTDIIGRLGLNEMTSSWPFAICILFLFVTLAFSFLKRIIPFKKKNLGYLLTHSSLWFTLLFATFGSGDIQRMELTVNEGQTEWRAVENQKIVHALPIAIHLNDFSIEEYPPKLVFINTDGQIIEKGNGADVIHFDGEVSKYELHGYTITINQFLNEAKSVSPGNLQAVNEPGSAPALNVSVIAPNGEPTTGWISCGSFNETPSFLKLSDDMALAMPAPEPKRYSSDVHLISQSGEEMNAIIEVNKPVRFAEYTVYQLSYDDRYGKWSETSILEVVRDPWLPYVYAGIFAMIASAFYIFWIGNKQTKQIKEA